MANNAKLKLVILSISLLQMGTTAIASILGSIASSFPDASSTAIQLLMTFPSLFVLVFALLSPMISTRIGKRNTILLGCLLFAASGVLSWMIHHSLTLLYIWAAMMGIGIGLVVPMATGSVAEFFTGSEQRDLMGWQSSAANIGAMLMTFAGGYLAMIHWSWNYLVYLIILPGLFLTWLYYPKESSGKKSELPFKYLGISRVALCCLLACSTTLFFNMIPTNISMLVRENGIGSSAQAGNAATLLLLSGTLMGIVFGKVSAKLGRYVILFGQGMLLIGMFILSRAQSLPMVYLGCLTGGCAISSIMPICMLGSAKASGNGAASGALQMGASNLGAFCSPFITNLAMKITGTVSVSGRFQTGIYLVLIAMVITFFAINAINKKKKQTN
ncbi:MAG: MFS transporter [Solobacterium sp.]|nr:MFS transporter [Solobacterium sp.]